MKPFLKLDDIHKSFGPVRAVRGLSLSIPTGQVVGFLGPNGAGKSTTIRIVTGILPPTRGRASINGLDSIESNREVRRLIGYLPESAPLHSEMRVSDYLAYRAALHGIRGRAGRAAVARAVERCQLGVMSRRRCGPLSKGYRQRVGLAAAIVHDPALLILDEPTSGLDPAQVIETRRIIRDLAGARTTIIVSHILPEVERSCDRIVIFARGRVVADGSPTALPAIGLSGRRVTAEVRAPSIEATREVLRRAGIAPHAQVEALPDGWSRLRLVFDASEPDPRPALAMAFADARIDLRELRDDAPSLEAFYIRAVERDGAAGDHPVHGEGGAA